VSASQAKDTHNDDKRVRILVLLIQAHKHCLMSRSEEGLVGVIGVIELCCVV